jgi:hypothetical protein
MVLGVDGRLTDQIALANDIAKKGSGRHIPMHPLLRTALGKLPKGANGQGRIVRSERGEALCAGSLVNWFIATRYDKLARNFLASVCLVAAIVWWIL